MKVFVHGLNSCGMRNTRMQAYRDYLEANGHELVDYPVEADILLLWTCAFRSDMKANSLAEIKRFEREYKAEVIVAGCLPDIDIEALRGRFRGRVVNWRDDEKKMKQVFGTPKVRLADIPLVLHKDQLYDDEATFRREHPEADVPYIGRYIQLYISDGCPFKCTYCSERLAFPPYHSHPEEQLIHTCRAAVEQTGKNAVVLLGDSIGDYGRDIGTSLPNLIRRLQQAIPDIRIAMQGVNPCHFLKFYDDMVEFLRSGLIVHLQIPFQSASDRILKLMNRPYDRAALDKVFGTINELGFREFDTHIIVGFPGETEDDFQRSLEFALDHHPKYVLLNGFMEAPEMPAARLPAKVDLETTLRRLLRAEARLKAAGILCNCDYGEFSRERFRRMNQTADTA
ncbi:MAG: radical SAM protein [Candidatus Methylomirabilia bacterium]